ncbi:MAG: hypothetical protein E7511_03145 [Ruminococcus sp.]|nr:hypothetical protein [Ruminococcus sp.]
MTSRYKASKADIEKALYSYYDEVADGLIRQAVAICLYAAHLQGWRRIRITRLYELLLDTMQLPPVMGKQLVGQDLMDFLTKEYGIDFNRCSVNKESFREFRKR